ncbi:hypothetical protein JAO73_14885 [Hymenobacter sp. BT523]|uniref:hypothetical protein n=1 Tax=Hymenobacter sp. BT523 TaxID=2795725 RepID=UPI0018ECF136|nr:hypothetical protein [Hymenobacter sp. BT523]MBJ6110307.1 hypothetical protein [Hymenobacter sp. BT523]
MPKELAVYYARAGDTLHVARLLEAEHRIALHRATLVEGHAMAQRPAPVRRVPADSLESVKRQLLSHYPWRPYASKYPEELFVQVDPAAEHRKETLLNVIAIMNERGNLEDAIGEALELEHLGQWVAGDLGPGGMNMLYEVNSATTALPVVVKTLEARQAQGRARIARRLMTSADDWRYEVVYPVDFSGAFNSM